MSRAFHIFSPRGVCLRGAWVHRLQIFFEFFQKVLEEQAPQVAQKNINLKILSELKVILPSIELQNEFADFVKQTDKSKLEIQKSLDKLEILKKSLMQQYFG